MIFRRDAAIVAVLSVCLEIRPSQLSGQDGTHTVDRAVALLDAVEVWQAKRDGAEVEP